MPRIRVAPEADRSYGDVAAEFAARFGLVADPWQRLVLDDWLARTHTDAGDRWAARNAGLSVPRQNGKNAILEIRELFGAVMLGEKILHTAHEVKTAKKHFRRLQHFFGKERNDPRAKYPELNALVEELRRVNGEEAIILTNGGSIEMAARSKSSARGWTVDVIVFDEAQQLDDDSYEALRSTNSAPPTGDPQTLYAGTPPGPNADGEVFTRQRNAALRKGGARCWHEWSMTGRLTGHGGPIDVHDRDLWCQTNPGLGYRLAVSTILDEVEDLKEDGFARERLGRWSETGLAHEPVIPLERWHELVSPGPDDGAPPTALAVDASHDRVVAVAACWATKESAHVEAYASLTDTFDVIEWIVERAGRRIPVVIDALSPAASIIPTLKARKVRVVQTSATDMGKACGLFYDDVLAGRLTHPGETFLDDALVGARKRAIRDAGAWGWDRKSPSVNIAPLVAATLARYGASLHPSRTNSTSNRRTTSRREAKLL